MLSWRGPVGLHIHLFAVVMVAILPAIGVALFGAAGAGHVIERVRQGQIGETADLLADAVDQTVDQTVAVLNGLSGGSGPDRHGLHGSGPTDDPVADFAARAEFVAGLTGAPVTLRRSDGTPMPLPSNAADEAGLRALAATALAGRRVAIGAAPAPDAGFAMAVAVPVLREGKAVGTIETQVPLDRLTASLRRRMRAQDGIAVLVDPQGRIAAASRDGARLMGRTLPMSGAPSFGPWPETEQPAEAARASAPVASAPGWRVVISRLIPARAVGLLLGDGLLAAMVATGLGIFMVGLLGKRLTRPLRELTELAGNVAMGSERRSVASRRSTITEFEELRQSMVRADAVLRRRTAAEATALREARTGHDLLISVVNGTAESIHVKDIELRYVLVNRAALASGPDRRAEWQVLGRSTAELFPPEVARRIEAADRTVLATGQMVSFEQDYVQEGQAGGEPRWVAMTIAPWQDMQGQVVGLVSVSRDITRQRVADARLRAVQADLLRATRLSAMGAMASGLAHELNQPLAAATNYLNAGSRLLDRGMAGDPASLTAGRGAVSDAARQLLRAGTIVRRLRDFVERGEVELRPEDAGDLLREACDLARSDGVNAGISLRLQIGAGSRVVLVDRTQIQQVVLNLIRNAAEAIASVPVGADDDLGRPGDILVAAGPSPDGGMRIEVIDNGPGLSPAIAERLFEPFVSSKPTGMGIGLSICRTIIEGHGGRLTAEVRAASDPSGGMMFRIALPALNPAGDQS